MNQSPKQFGIGDGKGYDSFSHLIYYYSGEQPDLQIVFQCLSEAPPEFQSRYIGLSSVFTIPNTLVLRHAYLPKKVVSLLKCFRQ